MVPISAPGPCNTRFARRLVACMSLQHTIVLPPTLSENSPRWGQNRHCPQPATSSPTSRPPKLLPDIYSTPLSTRICIPRHTRCVWPAPALSFVENPYPYYPTIAPKVTPPARPHALTWCSVMPPWYLVLRMFSYKTVCSLSVCVCLPCLMHCDLSRTPPCSILRRTLPSANIFGFLIIPRTPSSSDHCMSVHPPIALPKTLVPSDGFQILISFLLPALPYLLFSPPYPPWGFSPPRGPPGGSESRLGGTRSML